MIRANASATPRASRIFSEATNQPIDLSIRRQTIPPRIRNSPQRSPSDPDFSGLIPWIDPHKDLAVVVKITFTRKMETHLPGYDAIGFRIPTNDTQGFTKLLETIVALSKSYSCSEADCSAYSEDYFRVWTRISASGVQQILEGNSTPGMLAQIESFSGDHLAKICLWDHETKDPATPLFPLCVRTPHAWFDNKNALFSQTLSSSLTLLAQEATFFSDEETFKQHPDFGRFAPACIIALGLMPAEGQEDEGMKPSALVIGRVIMAIRSENGLSNDHFHALRVRTQGGECWINLPDSAVTSDVTGQIVAAQGITSATFPLNLPEPIENDYIGSLSQLTSTEMASRLRTRCIHFFRDAEASGPFLEDIHLTPAMATAVRAASLIKGSEGTVEKRGILTESLKARYQQAAEHAPIVFARIVMANTKVLHEGASSPALVVVAFGDGADAAMDNARKVLARVHFSKTTNAQEAALAALIEDEEYHFGKRRRLPTWLVGDVEAYAADLWIPAAAAFKDGLATDVLPCLAEHGEMGLTSTIPTNEILLATGRQPLPPKAPATRSPVSRNSGFSGLLAQLKKLAAIALLIMLLAILIPSLLLERTEELPSESDVVAIPTTLNGYQRANRKLENEVASGNSPTSRTHSERFIDQFKADAQTQRANFRSPLPEGALDNLSTHTNRRDSSILMLVRIPNLDSDNATSTHEELAERAWQTAIASINESFSDLSDQAELTLGIRGKTSYISTWQGKIGGAPTVKDTGTDLKKHLYEHFKRKS